ncbi:hypothetical protein PQS31_07875 [Luteimonas sp BLCC-B24]|uniref:hypothetical protein n=1 Tax=Luteimonas sp. BLCC-B24 TaxID=3025317 RepID=UPI00234E2DCE|nr:hypothetical protein [Luteimonas sp. BLCC-B24]MDC7806734.1 hypothetical protein [Luteimonas sp. BLCC-B24]
MKIPPITFPAIDSQNLTGWESARATDLAPDLVMLTLLPLITSEYVSIKMWTATTAVSSPTMVAEIRRA